jgi:adenosylmethionine-8-amino-7-oxononanoate aminotransferase
MIEPMLALLEQHHHELCAVIVEPLVQCAGSMRMYHPVYLELLRDACHHYHVHLIADEIAVGFGRTGSLFACEQANVSPDFLCLSKGITGGYLPLAVVLTSAQVYGAFYADYTLQRAFLHSHSYTGNPLACAAALATLDLIEDEDIITRNAATARVMQEATRQFLDHPHVAEVRQTGMIVAIEFVRDKATRAPYPWQERRGLRVYRHALDRGALLRPLGSVIYFMPPYVVTGAEIRFLAEVAWEGLDLATREP